MAWTQLITVFVLVASYGWSEVSAQTDEEATGSDGTLRFSLEPQTVGGFQLVATKDGERDILGHIGRWLLTGSVTYVDIESDILLQTGATTFNFSVHHDDNEGAYRIRVSWDTSIEQRLEDCFHFGSKHWYGGPEQFNQMWPIQTANLQESSYVSKEDDNGAIEERYWLNSAGQYYYVHPQVPLFVDYHNVVENSICFISQVAPPYSSRRIHNELTYDIWFLDNAKTAHQHAVNTYLGKPSGVPDVRMIQHPIWSTWAKFSRDIDENNLWEFANEIVTNGFDNAQFEIDDLWEVCYGSLEVDELKFSNFSGFVGSLKSLGFRVTIWVHPFINQNCDPWYSEALENGYLVLTEEGSPDTNWWNSNGSVSSYVDFTNPEAAAWWSGRVRNLLEAYGIDSVKFDAGESSFSPQIPVQNGDIDLHPSHIVADYVRTCAEFGSQIEIRSGARTQELPVFVRMVDKDTLWGFNNGLKTVVTTLLQMNLNGYTLVLPDMIGGNGMNLNADVLPNKELFIRWLQANVFMPSLQFSFVPWDFDNETVEISRIYTELHAQYADEIVAAIEASVARGTPVNPPIWWLDPTDEEALAIWDQFLLGEKILVAPILDEGAESRDIYLPQGVWYAEGNEELAYEGPQWLYNYSAPLDHLPYFVREDDQLISSSSDLQCVLLVVVTVAIVKFLL